MICASRWEATLGHAKLDQSHVMDIVIINKKETFTIM